MVVENPAGFFDDLITDVFPFGTSVCNDQLQNFNKITQTAALTITTTRDQRILDLRLKDNRILLFKLNKIIVNFRYLDAVKFFLSESADGCVSV